MDDFNAKTSKPRHCRAIDITLGDKKSRRKLADEFGWWAVWWGTDIFVNDIPILKVMVLANVIVLAASLLIAVR